MRRALFVPIENSYHPNPMKNKAVSQAIEVRLARFREKSRVQAGSLITTVFGDAILPRGGRVWLGSLIRLLQPLEVNERLVRTAVFRLVKDEWLQAQAHGRKTDYMLTPSGQQRFDEAARQIYATDIPVWDRHWRLLLVLGEVDSKLREQLRRSLFWQGFGELSTGSFIHPCADLDTVLESLSADGLRDLRPQLMPLVAVDAKTGGSASDLDLVRRAWNLDALAVSYKAFLESYGPIFDALVAKGADGVSEESAFLTRTLLIHDVRKLLLRDPQLPEGLLPEDWPGSKVRVLCREIYRSLLPLSERHLDSNVQLSNGDAPHTRPVLAGRFGLIDAALQPLWR